MEIWLFVGLVLTVLSVLLSKKGVKEERSSDKDKILLKQLLEGFGLEVPSELKELEGAVIKSIKMN